MAQNLRAPEWIVDDAESPPALFFVSGSLTRYPVDVAPIKQHLLMEPTLFTTVILSSGLPFRL